MAFKPFTSNDDLSMKYDKWKEVTVGEGKNKIIQMQNTGDDKVFTIHNSEEILASNLIFSKNDIAWYNKYNRYGCIDPYNTYSNNREFLLFTKPDLNIFKSSSYPTSINDLNDGCKNIPLFQDAFNRHINVLAQLQYSVKDSDGGSNPFMYLLSNAVTSKLDLHTTTLFNRWSDEGYNYSFDMDRAYIDIKYKQTACNVCSM